MCIKPQRGKCQPPDGTILVLTQTKPCDQPFMQFTLSADGTLKHHCSGKMVCPRKPAQGKRCELMISSKCQPQDAKFERTAGMISKLDRSFVLHQNYPLTPQGSRGCSSVPASNTHRSRSLCSLFSTLGHSVIDSSLFSERFFSGYSGFPLSSKTLTFPNSNSILECTYISERVLVNSLVLRG